MIMSMCGKDVESTYVSNTLTPINSTVMSSMTAGTFTLRSLPGR